MHWTLQNELSVEENNLSKMCIPNACVHIRNFIKCCYYLGVLRDAKILIRGRRRFAEWFTCCLAMGNPVHYKITWSLSEPLSPANQDVLYSVAIPLKYLLTKASKAAASKLQTFNRWSNSYLANKYTSLNSRNIFIYSNLLDSVQRLSMGYNDLQWS